MNENKLDNRRSFRIIVGLILFGAVALLIGAGRLGDSMITRQAEQTAAHAQWKSSVEQLLNQEKDLRTLATSHPEYILQTLHSGMRPETQD